MSKNKKIIKFQRDNCNPCKTYEPIFNDVVDEYKDEFDIEIVDVEDKVDMARDYKILSVPTTLLIVDGEIKEREMGILQKQELIELLSDYVSP